MQIFRRITKPRDFRRGTKYGRMLYIFPSSIITSCHVLLEVRKYAGVLEEVVANRPDRGVDGRLFYGGR